jgi:methylthioribulose-1-phosphate dehydratase
MPRDSLKSTANRLAAVGRRFYARGWALGTSGNFSSVVSLRPFRLAITASSVPKGALGAGDIVVCDEQGTVRGRKGGRPSAETLLHVEIARKRGAAAVLHTHSVWSTMLSDTGARSGRERSDRGELTIEGYEMLKGLAGVRSHEHREIIPILDNDQDMPRLAARVGDTLDRFPDAHAFLLRRHGLYTWGRTLDEAERHVEILEFLFETIGRTQSVSRGEAAGGTAWRS